MQRFQPLFSTKKELTPSERFLGMVMKNFAAVPGEIKLAPFHQKLIQNYFIKLDMVLKTAEAKDWRSLNSIVKHLRTRGTTLTVKKCRLM